ncbi:hypothetical protein CO054_00285 [Candidatus Shapirobacteria bacterium CG_4_9_14_0_2_um_filter_39_11]|uniref:Uncharacterized protein n=1 Tax=Candidatus Shapirobacteria bacterium CG_4_9_14_0_2_um_filter_39_11 TaxID=1974478 RepID=A0A2M8ETF3_9BACT|nr:MAG: hypothetical protein CO054_00285 [Candidatus Shapirobacteria bacterium CG_4_9_14_0_2_um_filter_39_11]
MRDKERFYPDTRPLLSNEAIGRLVRYCHSEAQVKTLLKKEGLSLSPDSMRNVFYALLVLREIRVDTPFSYFIYGSTATGKAGLESRIQEFQFWQGENFFGSTFRFYGDSDLDIRCLSEAPEAIGATLQRCQEKLRRLMPPVGIRIDSYDFAFEDITNQEAPSFYRGILVLNKPLVLYGRDKLDAFVSVGVTHLIPQDFDCENQMRQAKSFVRSRLKETNVLYLPESQLKQLFPVYYDPTNLKEVNIKRRLSPKISFGSRESSLIAIQVRNLEEIDRFNQIISAYSEAPFEEIKLLV